MKPYPHQLEAISYLEERKSGFVFVEQRGGKTKPTVTASLTLPLFDTSSILIVTKSTAMVVWLNELTAQGVPVDQIQIIQGTRIQKVALLRDKRIESEVPFIICNWDMVKDYKMIDRRVWLAIIFDESSCVANASSKVTQYCIRATRRLREKSPLRPPYIMALSGKPAPESPIQYAAQALIVDGIYLGYTRLDEYIHDNWKDNPKKPGNLNKMLPMNLDHLIEIKRWVSLNCFVRTLDQLGLGSERLYDRRYVDMNVLQKKAMKWAISKKASLPKDIGDKVFVGYMNQIAAGVNPEDGKLINAAKIQEVLTCYLENPEPIVVFSFFKAPLKGADVIFRLAGIPCAVITGETKKSIVDEAIQEFQDGNLQVLFAQTDLIKMGRDLSRSNLTYYLNNSFSSDTRDQSEMRTTNITKKIPVGIVDICTRDTMDETIVNMLVRKDKISDSFLVSAMKKVERQYDKEST